jgi:hypothetical protein
MKVEEIPSNTAVFTTRFVIAENSPILYVTCDSDGDWHFMGDDDVTEEDAKLVSIKNILDLDNTLKDLPPLEEGYRAIRESKDDEWELYEISE